MEPTTPWCKEDGKEEEEGGFGYGCEKEEEEGCGHGPCVYHPYTSPFHTYTSTHMYIIYKCMHTYTHLQNDNKKGWYE